ncbi:MAG: phosphoenolpyruvate carboxykinase (GTP) [Candidatus Omnitrophica bacterium]|nr:phosphoenolpyruvate carboxykinase (GTP) [Candidatus Omnitrophota bacterium]
MIKYMKTLKDKCQTGSFEKLLALDNAEVCKFVSKYAELCNPDSIFVSNDSKEDSTYIRNRAVELGEEKRLGVKGQTYHFDGINDQGRDPGKTQYLLPRGVTLGSDIQSMNRKKGLDEMFHLMKNSMRSKQMYVGFFCLGPCDSEFSILAAQITDSAYVLHSEDILVRDGYEQFKKAKKKDFFKFVHSAGVIENDVSRNYPNKRIYIDLKENTVYSANTQYAGNTVGLKKLAMRLAIQKASSENWLTEHMFIMGAHGPNSRTTYFCGSFPSACGKTSTCMLEGETIVGDDIAYLRKINGKIRAVNVEQGIFGIIKDVNAKDDPSIYEALVTPGEVIFSNILVTEDNMPWWIGKNDNTPLKGINYSGQWHTGKTNDQNIEITPSHTNARYTIRLSSLKNKDPKADDANGVEIKGVIYGGRDSDTSVPVEQAFDWNHGILTKAATLESETTSATLGQEGVRKFNLMANIDFLSIPMGRYIMNNINFVEGIENPPPVFFVNYFLKDKHGKFLTGMKDKHVWLKWMELRIHKDVGAIKTPTGYMPKYDDLKPLFRDILGREYKKEDYITQFTVRIPENLAKIERISKIYHKVPDAPDILFKALAEQEKRLKQVEEKYGEYISPEKLIG